MKPQLFIRWILSLAIIASLLVAGPVTAAEVHVMISAAFYRAYSELVPVFEQETGHRLVTTRGPSLGDSPEAIPNRLSRGEPADVPGCQQRQCEHFGPEGNRPRALE